jgi:hypothetical protein
VEQLLTFPAFTDPEGLYYWAHACAGFGESDLALDLLNRAIDSGWHCPKGLETTPAFHHLRQDPRFVSLLANARAQHQLAADAFARADGHQLLGLSRSATSQH